MMPSAVSESTKEIEGVKKECLGLLADLRAFYPLPPGTTNYPNTYKLMVIPLLYAAWQRCFTLCNAIAWRKLRDEASAAEELTQGQRAVWLLQTDFYQSFIHTLWNSNANGFENARPKRSHQPALAKFLEELQSWNKSALDLQVESEKLVMTFSNVKPDVVHHNAKALGIDTYPLFQDLRLGRLNSLVGLRNNIGHGGTISPPPDEEFNQLWPFTEKLIADYSEMFKQWLMMRFPPVASAPSDSTLGLLDSQSV